MSPCVQACPSGSRAADRRYVPPAFITCILLVGHLSFGILEAGRRRCWRLRSASRSSWRSAEFLSQWLHPPVPISRHQRRHSDSLARLLALCACSAISITSKYVLRVKGRHLWNPSNFGISAMLFLAGDTVAS
jgi:hypothetical protein